VRLRLREYCGGTAVQAPTCVHLTALSDVDGPLATWEHATRYPVDALASLLDSGADISRSLWDDRSLLIHLDIDYQNTDFPGEAFHHPAEVFFKLEPVYRTIVHLLRRLGLPLLPIMTGQGYHFTGRVPLDSDVVDRVAALAPEPHWQSSVAERRPPWITARLDSHRARAYVGAGMLVEWLAHRILQRARPRSKLPIVLNGTVVGTGLVGRESVSLDLSYAGDPMDVRHVRVAFGAYQKHRFRPDLVGSRVSSVILPFVAVPRLGQSLECLLSRGRDLRHAARLARTQSAALPVVTDGVRALIDAYQSSALAAFHRGFYETPILRGLQRDEWFASLPVDSWPPCIRRPLTQPNDLLLQPAWIQHVTRFLLAEGFNPRHVSAAVHSRYAADFDWGARWSWLDAETRAEFDVRVFAGLAACGVDRAVDFNCRSAWEKDLCPGGVCGHDLRTDRDRLLNEGRA
jgi:hypothetical protein